MGEHLAVASERGKEYGVKGWGLLKSAYASVASQVENVARDNGYKVDLGEHLFLETSPLYQKHFTAKKGSFASLSGRKTSPGTTATEWTSVSIPWNLGPYTKSILQPRKACLGASQIENSPGTTAIEWTLVSISWKRAPYTKSTSQPRKTRLRVSYRSLRRIGEAGNGVKADPRWLMKLCTRFRLPLFVQAEASYWMSRQLRCMLQLRNPGFQPPQGAPSCRQQAQ